MRKTAYRKQKCILFVVIYISSSFIYPVAIYSGAIYSSLFSWVLSTIIEMANLRDCLIDAFSPVVALAFVVGGIEALQLG